MGLGSDSSRRRFVCFILLTFICTVASQARADSNAPQDSLGQGVEVIVVTATRKQQPLAQVPAAVSVVGDREIRQNPTDHIFSDLLRGIPGVNVARTNGTDVSVSTRTATGTIPQGQLAMMDHRTVYQDFNGFVFWAGLAVEREDIDRIEVVRGPGSSVWGANALHGIIHIVTKAPRDMVGTRLKLGGGEMGTGFSSLTHAGVQGRLGYRISVGHSVQDPFEPPTGLVPGSKGPGNPLGLSYPDYDPLTSRTSRANFRVDFDSDEQSTWSFSGGYAQVDGGFLSPGGPTTMEDGTLSAFAKLDWTRGDTRVTAFVNRDDAAGTFVRGNFRFETEGEYTYNLDATDTRTVGARHTLTYGGNARYNTYDFEGGLAANGENRESFGAFFQDDILLTDQLRFIGGARWDYVDPMGSAISPRASLVLTPFTRHQFRVSYNRAFQAPSMLQNYLDFPNFTVRLFPNYNDTNDPNPVPVVLAGRSIGDTDLEPKQLDAFEVGWNGTFGERLKLSAAAYWNEFNNSFQFAPVEFYTSSNPPPGWPFDPALLDGELANSLVAVLQQINLGRTTAKGVELGLELRLNRDWSGYGTWSWQDATETADFASVIFPDGNRLIPLNVAPRNRFTLGAAYDVSRFFVNGNVSYQGEAVWTEIGGWGTTDSFALVNAGAGIRLQEESLVLSVNAANLFDERAQQHLWGDLMERRVYGQVTYWF